MNLKVLLKGKKRLQRNLLCARAAYLKTWFVLGLLISELVVTVR